MSDSSVILCIDGIVDNNIQIGSCIISYLQSEQVITNKLSNCAFGLGYSRGERYASVVKYEEGESLITNGVKFKLSPAAYCEFELSPEMVVNCPACGKNQFKDISVADFYEETLTREQLRPYNRVSGALSNYTGVFTELACCHCNVQSEIADYDFKGRLTFSNFAMEIFNWGELTPEFVEKLESLSGYKLDSYINRY